MSYRNKFAILLTGVMLGAATLAQAAPVKNLRTSVSPARVRIVLDSEEPVQYKAAKNGLQLVVSLPASTATAQQAKLKDTLVKAARVAPDGRKASKLLIDLSKDAQYKVYQLANPYRLVVDIYRISILKQSRELAKGVTYTYLQDEMNGRQLQAHLVSVAPNAKYRLLPFSAAGAYNGRGSLAQVAKQTQMPAAMNASYFDTDGWVIGSIKNQGTMMAADSQPRSGYALQDGQPRIVQDIGYYGTLTLPSGRSLELKGMNRARISEDLVLYNSFYAPTTKTNSWGREVKLVNGRVTEISTAGNMAISSGSVVISGHGSAAAALANLKIGDRVTLSETLGAAAADAAQTVVSGGPLLVEKGQAHVRSAEENMAADIAKGRAPRTALGLKRDGTLLMLVVDGRSSDSAGLTLAELAAYLLRLGAYDAVNFDGGGSSEMVINGRVVNKPSDGSERRVSIGLGLFDK
jgi:exopolysaccharide biosynthesis protein